MLNAKLQKSAIDSFGAGKDSGMNTGSLLPAQCRAQCSSPGAWFGVAVLPVGPALLQPGGSLGLANHSWQQQWFEQGKDCVCGKGRANRVKGRVMLCTQEPAGRPQITDIFPSTC